MDFFTTGNAVGRRDEREKFAWVDFWMWGAIIFEMTRSHNLVFFTVLALVLLGLRYWGDEETKDAGSSGSSNTATESEQGAENDSLEAEQGSRLRVAEREESTRSKLITTASGLQYEILAEGEGDPPGPSDTVEVHYEGTLEDGTIFDSSYQRGRAAAFPLNAVIGGWTEGLQLMKPGAKYRFIIPPELAYGEKGAGQSIPGGATLTFEVELLSVKTRN